MKYFRKAILIVHGFTGSLSDHEILANDLETVSHFDVYSWTLPAHDKHIINKVKYTDWIEAVDNQLEFLINKGYQRIYIVGHSMGGLLSGYAASKYPQIKKIVFLSAAYDYFSKEQYKEDFQSGEMFRDGDASYRNLGYKLLKVPFTTMIQFRILVKKYKGYIKKVTQEALVIHGNKDEVVPYSAMNLIKANISSKKVTYTTIIDGRHVLLRGRKKEELSNYIKIFLIGGRKWKKMKKSQI